MARPKVLGNVRRMMVSLPEELAEAGDDYRFANRIKTDADTPRRLIAAGLNGAKPSAPRGTDPGGSDKPTRPKPAPRAKPAAEPKPAAPSSKLDQIRALREQG